MRRRASILPLLAAVLVLAPTASGASGERLRLTEAGGARFPDRSFVLTLPADSALAPEGVHVLENGKRVSRVSLTPASAAGEDQLGVVLAIDASDSMKGGAIEGAMAAARAFAARRNPEQQLAVVAFNGGVKVLLPFTTDGAAIDAALAEPPDLAYGTRIYDAVETAISLVEEAQMKSASIVVLSDGADHGSRAAPDEVVQQAEAANVRIFAIGLRSGKFTPWALRSLAESGGGEYAEARSADHLAPIYARLGSKLANEYILRYRSLAGPSETVRVRVAVDRMGFAISGYVTPALPLHRPEPFRPSVSHEIWRSTTTMVAFALAAAAILGLSVLFLLRPRASVVVTRLGQFVSLPRAGAGEDEKRTDAAFDRTERALERTRWWTRFEEDVELGEIKMRAVQIVLWTVVAAAFAGWVLYVLGGSLLLAALGLLVPVAVRAFVKRRARRRRNAFAEQLPDNLQVLASALRAGHSLVGALSVVVDDSPEPSRSEFRRVIADEQLGVPLDRALETVAQRMQNDDLEQVALVAALQRDSGGNSAEVLDRVAETVRERFELRRMVKALTAQGRMARWIVSLLPLGLLVVLTLLNAAYMNPLYTTTPGRLLLALGSIMVVLGSLAIKKIVNIKV